MTTTSSIGPGAIATPSVKGAPRFSLSNSDWLAIQVYVENALTLPTDMAGFVQSLGDGAPSDPSDFDRLVTAYSNIHDHVTVWKNEVFPETVSLASDIHNYAQEAPTYYNPILPLANKLVENPNDEQTKAQLAAVLQVLIKSATDKHDAAAAVVTKIQTFANQTEDDKRTLSGVDNKGGLVKYYNDKYGATSTEVQQLTDDITAQTIILNAANKEYKHDVIVASTTATYAWVPLVGFIAAATVAGVYGDKAVKALDRAHAAQKKIDTFNAQLAADVRLMAAINLAEGGISNILGPLNAALPVIQHIQGVWGAISDDLGNITSLIENNIQDALPIIMNLGVEAALNAWTAVGQEADAYRTNAYITAPQPAPVTNPV